MRKYQGYGPKITYDLKFPSGSAGFATVNVAVDQDGTANLVGSTSALSFPLYAATRACDFANSPDQEAFLIRLSAGGDMLQSTYLSHTSSAYAMAVSSSIGYVAGLITSSPSGPAGFAVLTLGPVIEGPSGAISFWCIGNAASLGPGNLAPGEVVSLFGDGLGPSMGISANVSSGQQISSELAGTKVLFDGVSAPVLFVESGQINAITPWGLAGKHESQICVVVGTSQTNCIAATIAAAAPGVVMASPGRAAAINQDGSVNSPQNPAEIGSIISLFATGIGTLTPPQPDGTIIQYPLSTQDNRVEVLFQTTAQTPGEILYAGPAPFEPAGVTQINVMLQAGSISVRVLALDGSQSQTDFFTVATKEQPLSR